MKNKKVSERFVITFNPSKINKNLYLMKTDGRSAVFTENLEHAQIILKEEEAKHIVEFLCSAYIDVMKYEDKKSEITTLLYNTRYELPERVDILQVILIENPNETVKLDREFLKYIMDREGY